MKFFAAAAYKVEDHGDGGVRLFVREYDHRPYDWEVRVDVFEVEVPDWKDLWPYTMNRDDLREAARTWEDHLYAPLTIEVVEVVEVSDE